MNNKQRLKLLDAYCNSIYKKHYKKALEQNRQIYTEIYDNLMQNNNKKNAIFVLRELKEAYIEINRCMGIIFPNLNFQGGQ